MRAPSAGPRAAAAAPPAPHRTRGHYGAGVAASLVAETAFVLLTMALAFVRGRDPWHVTRAPASMLVGPAAADPPGFAAGDVALGLATHGAMAVAVGLAYAALLPRLRWSPVAGGLLTAAVLYVIGFWILPALWPHWLSPMRLPMPERLVSAATHAAYGVVFGVAYRALARPAGG